MKKDGFIATSLIYSFFLVFIAIIAALLSNYIANKTILLRYNEEALSELNTKKYSVSFVIYGAEGNTLSQKSQAFTNLVQNGSFNSTEWWNTQGTLNFSSTSFSRNTSQLTNAASSSYIYQNVHLVRNQKYYFSIDYSQTETAPIQVYVEPMVSLITKNTDGTWDHTSTVFYAEESTDSKPFVIGYSATGYNKAYFTNATLINLTEHFGIGNEPTARWMDENIEFFDGTINYLREANLDGGSNLELTMKSQKDLSNMTSVCRGVNDEWYATNENVEETVDVSGERPTAKFNIKNITDDIKCIVRWSE